MTKSEPTRTEWVLLLITGALIAALLVGCDNYARVTAPDVTINVTSAPTPPAAPAVPAPNETEPGSTDLMDPPSDTDVPFNGDTPDTPDTPDTSRPCDGPGRGDANGSPGKGKGQGDENGKCGR